MSMSRKDYLMLAIDITDSEIDLYNEKYLPFIEGWKGEKFSIINDDMSGRYSYFGITLKTSNSDDGFDREPVEKVFDSFYIFETKRDIINRAKSLFNIEYSIPCVKLYCITKWS